MRCGVGSAGGLSGGGGGPVVVYNVAFEVDSFVQPFDCA